MTTEIDALIECRGTEDQRSKPYIDGDDIIARSGALRTALDAIYALPPDEQADYEWEISDMIEEFGLLEELQADTYGFSKDSRYIADFEFEDYAEEFAADVEGVDRHSSLWNYIDWTRYADDMKGDYQQVEFGRDIYWVRD